jgi:P27 family predicted phage terminase small subunit
MPTKRGPKPKTAHNTKRRPARKAPSATAPGHLSDQEKAIFRQVVAKLKGFGVLDRTDPTLIELYAVNYALLINARKEVEKDGLTSMTRFGSAAAHPMLAVMNQATIRLKGVLNDLGLTPASSKLSAPPEKGGKRNDPWEGLLNIVG